MAAGQGFKTFTTGEVLTAADVNGYLMQGVLVFASEAARDAAITSPQEGQFAYTKDNNSLWYYTGSAWASSGATGDIEGVTAGVGISGGGTSGTVTITNSMATAIDAKGDLIAGTGADAFSRLAVGTNGQVLTADSTAGAGVAWATPGGALNISQIATGNINSGTSVVISSLTQDFLYLVISGVTWATADAQLQLLINGSTSSVYYQQGFDVGSGSPTAGRVIYTGTSLALGVSTTYNSTNNNYGVVLQNCKSTGFTNYDVISGVITTASSTTRGTVVNGIFTTAAQVTSLTINNSGGRTFNGTGTYTLYGA